MGLRAQDSFSGEIASLGHRALTEVSVLRLAPYSDTSLLQVFISSHTFGAAFCLPVDYLGVGYDSIKGNPIGDPDMMVDPGLRSPILKFRFAQDTDGVTNDLEHLQPIGAFTRPFAACRQSETVSELDSLADYQKELSVDASLRGGDMLGLNSFSGSSGYKQFAQQTSHKQAKSFMLKTYCLRYEAGIAQNASFKW